MTTEHHQDFPPAARRRGGRRVLFAGVAGACVLGVGLGLWARPSMDERQAAIRLAGAPARVARQLQVVVDDGPAPLGAPIEVLSAAPVPAAPPQGLVRVETLSPPPALAALKPAVKAAAAPRPPVRLARPKLQVAKARPVAASPARASRKVELARAEAAKAVARRLDVARAKSRLAARQEQLRLAKAEARGRAEARAEAKAEALAQARAAAVRARVQLAKLTRSAAHAPPAKAKSRARQSELARLDHKAAPRRAPPVQHVAVKARKAPRAAEPAYRRAPAPIAPQPRPDGLMKVSTPRCGAAHPCADPALGAAERQLARAYQGARAAGVPDAQLQRRQQRWLAARSAAAREAPWALRDVYLARIAELNGMARDARRGGY